MAKTNTLRPASESESGDDGQAPSPLRVNRVVPTVCRSLPVYPAKQTFSEPFGDRPGREHVELFSVYRLEHGVEPRALIPALCATDAGILVNPHYVPAQPGGNRQHSRRWLYVSCFDVDTLR